MSSKGPFGSYSSLPEALLATKDAMTSMESIPDSQVRNDGRYQDFSQMKSHWHVFEGGLNESHEHIANHFTQDHADGRWSYELKQYGTGLRVLTASSTRSGHNHFLWRTSDDRFVLVLSDDKSA